MLEPLSCPCVPRLPLDASLFPALPLLSSETKKLRLGYLFLVKNCCFTQNLVLEPEKSMTVLLVSDRAFLLHPSGKRASQNQMEEAGPSGLYNEVTPVILMNLFISS